MKKAISLFVGAFLGLSAQVSFAAGFDVVKILSFSCSVCHSTEGQDDAIAARVARGGGKYVKAPIISLPDDDGAMAKTYYAARKFPNNLAVRINNSFFKASQTMGVQLMNTSQVYNWIQQDLYSVLDEKGLNALMTAATGSEATASFVRALQIAKLAGVNSLPAYVVMKDGEFITSVDPSIAPGGPSAMREALYKKLDSLEAVDKERETSAKSATSSE